MAAEHSFDQCLMDTVIQRNLNPIERVERTLLITVCTVHGKSVEDLVHPEHLERVLEMHPGLETL